MIIFVVMNTFHEKPVSLRKFAAMTGTSDGGVRKAIGKGSINLGVIDGKILPSVASIEWGKGIVSGWVLTNDGDWEIEKANTDPLDIIKPEDITTPEDLFEVQDSRLQFINEVDDIVSADHDLDGLEDTLATRDQFLKDIPQSTGKIEAERLYSVFRARKMKRELQKLEGELVDKRLVYQNLFEFASNIRDGMLNIPERVIDNILAADTRSECVVLLTEEIEDVLKSLSEVGEIKLTKDDSHIITE